MDQTEAMFIRVMQVPKYKVKAAELLMYEINEALQFIFDQNKALYHFIFWTKCPYVVKRTWHNHYK